MNIKAATLFVITGSIEETLQSIYDTGWFPIGQLVQVEFQGRVVSAIPSCKYWKTTNA